MPDAQFLFLFTFRSGRYFWKDAVFHFFKTIQIILFLCTLLLANILLERKKLKEKEGRTMTEYVFIFSTFYAIENCFGIEHQHISNCAYERTTLIFIPV